MRFQYSFSKLQKHDIMKTSEKLSFPKLENEFLENILRQLVNQYTIIQLFFTNEPAPLFSQLIIHIKNNEEAEQLQQNKWIKKVRDCHQVEVCLIYSARLHHRFAMGHPFMEWYCRPSSLIYQNAAAGDPLIIKRDWKKYKNKFNAFQERFYHDHDLQRSQIQNLVAEGAANSVFTSYARLMEYDLEYLEELYLGNKSAALGLEERIKTLTAYIPEIQKYFVKKSHNKYYLLDLFAKAKEAAAEEEEIYKNEMHQALEITEQSLYRLIEKRLNELKKQIKKASFEKQEVAGQIEEKPTDPMLELAIETIVKAIEAEQIYKYHQITYGEKTTYYLMIIADGAGNEKGKAVTQSLKSKTGEKQDFVMLCHSRNWIQANLYQYQSFFAGIIQDKYQIYASSPYHPDLHWEVPHNPYHADLYLYYTSAKNTALQFLAIARNENENHQGLEYLFALFFLSFCRTYIFIKTYYLPNDLSSQALWQLCIYADPAIRKHNHLTEQFWTDFFPFLDKHRTLHQKWSNLKKNELDQMVVIAEKLLDELHNLVIEGGLLNGEQDK
ncbi:MAG: hypothetical protein H7Y10_14860 [Flavobacterium sp.]|nr:hypothetical protein [Flavobacterium sp.]